MHAIYMCLPCVRTVCSCKTIAEHPACGPTADRADRWWLLWGVQSQQLLLAQPGQQSAAAAGGQEQEPQRPPSKTCSKCKTEKPSAEFFRDKSKPDGMYSQVCNYPAAQWHSVVPLLLPSSCDRDHVICTALQLAAWHATVTMERTALG